MKTLFAKFVGILLVAVVADHASAQVAISLVDGRAVEAASMTVGDGRLSARDAHGVETGVWPLEEVAAVQFNHAPAGDAASADDSGAREAAASSSGETAQAADQVLTTGGVLSGRVTGFDGKTFTVTGTEFGDLQVPLDVVRVVRLAGADVGGLGAEESRTDVVVLANGDRLPGTVNRIDAKTVEFHSAALGDRSLERSRVTAIQVGAPAQGRPEIAMPLLRVATRGGGSLELGSAATETAGLRGLLGGRVSIVTPLASIVRIEVIGGRLVPLETLKPSEYQQQSLDVLSWPLQVGRNVLGEPMRLRDERGQVVTLDSGIGVHAPCLVAYDLGGGYQRFLATVGIDESAGKFADVNLVVKVDGKEAFRADHVKWQEPARQINIPVQGARRLELIVEAGDHFDVQDRVNWARASLLRDKAK